MRPSSAEKDKSLPHWVGRYEVLVPIASGGMATVYLARSRGAAGFERDVALKLTHKHLRDSPEFQSVLIEEAKLASAIRHNNVVPILDVGDDPQGLFLVMDYVEGDTLSGLVRRARNAGEELPRRFGFRILLDALAGVHAAHETLDAAGQPLSIVHRDFSPHNILVGTDGVSRLTDFGIAKAASRTGNTATGIIKGKIAYMSPEQARGGTIDRRCDVWAAGVVAWELVANRPMWPRNGEDMATLLKLVTQPPPSLREAASDVPADVEDVINKAIAPEMEDRWPTAAAFAKALSKVLEKHEWLADADEVAEYVRAAAGPKLAHRRLQAQAAVELRGKLGEVAEQTVATESGLVPIASPPDGVDAGDGNTVISESAPQMIAPVAPAPAAPPPATLQVDEAPAFAPPPAAPEQIEVEPQQIPVHVEPPPPARPQAAAHEAPAVEPASYAPYVELPSSGTHSSVAIPAAVAPRRSLVPVVGGVMGAMMLLVAIAGGASLVRRGSSSAAGPTATTTTMETPTATATPTATEMPTATASAVPTATVSAVPTTTASAENSALATATATSKPAATTTATGKPALAPWVDSPPTATTRPPTPTPKTSGAKLAPSPF